MSKRRSSFLILALVVLAPLEARADAGTPLMWLTAFQLFIGNLVIGFGEGLLLSHIYKVARGRAMLVMVLANYFSAWCGFYILDVVARDYGNELAGDQPLYRAGALLALGIGALYALTVLLEWPFVAFLLRGRPRFAWKALPASLLAQSASYLVLVPLFLAVSSMGLLTDVRRDASVVQGANPALSVYFVAPNRKDVMRMTLGGGAPQKVGRVPAGLLNPVLIPRLNNQAAKWDLVVANGAAPYDPAHAPIILAGFANATTAPGTFGRTGLPEGASHSDFRPPLDCANGSEWHVRYPRLSDWASSGLTFRNERLNRDYHAAVETIAFLWRARSATRLPRDQVLFSFIGGRPQIVLLDMPTQRIGLVALGMSPVVTFNDAIPVWQRAEGETAQSAMKCEE